ncbi:TPA: hypothetical protein N0F65_002484 [Lagenidium giganteum]|uniref:DDE Tnp4 domain-containing protein n=1 Tax=Lagenidium giganteum TaxID=4803 RepID=A0AAV2YZ74_9STRA|nr:TPA: hypothetical protein N0F65_002484 [Lagenidium giganteum]
MRMFASPISQPANMKEAHFTRRQESCRKDVERSFGVLKGRFHIIDRPSRLWSISDMEIVYLTCIILHNVIIEHDTGHVDMEHEYARPATPYSTFESSRMEIAANAAVLIECERKYIHHCECISL